MTAKYIRTKDNSIIVFSAAMKHSEFANFKPVSAGFIQIGTRGHEIIAKCYGMSTSLGICTLPEDTQIALRQICDKQY